MELSSLKPELDQMGVNLVGVVHEEKGAKEFQPYLNSTIYLDKEVTHRHQTTKITVLHLLASSRKGGISSHKAGRGGSITEGETAYYICPS